MGSADDLLRCDGCGKPFDANIPATCLGGKAHGFTIRPVEVTTFSPSVSPVDARLARVEAENKRMREALTWIAAQSCRRDAPCFELNACITERCETCYARAALKEGS